MSMAIQLDTDMGVYKGSKLYRRR